MLDGIMIVAPDEIEKKSFETITQLLAGKAIDPRYEPIIKRVIHTTADLEYADILKISEGALEKGIGAIGKSPELPSVWSGPAPINKTEFL
jgi:precorrin-8X/cobalt-precorrin-8 methylmutase